MKKTLLFTYFLIVFVTTNSLRSQSVYKNSDIDKYISKTTVTDDHNFTYVGSPYFNVEFQKGVIYKNSLALEYNVGLRYNANKDVFEIKKTFALKDNQAKYLFKTDEITLKIKNNHFVFIPASKKNNVHGYIILLYKGEQLSLYKKINKLFIAGQKAYSSLARDVQPTYKEKVILFLVDKDGKFSELPNSKNGKIKIFNDHTKELKQYVKENHLNINKENNLVKLVKYYDSL